MLYDLINTVYSCPSTKSGIINRLSLFTLRNARSDIPNVDGSFSIAFAVNREFVGVGSYSIIREDDGLKKSNLNGLTNILITSFDAPPKLYDRKKIVYVWSLVNPAMDN